ncbi:MAG: AI-2E family transporter [Alphaproteobacteria bacterium]
MNISPKLWPWIIAASLIFLMFYSISNILMPFIVGLFLAYIMNPAVTRMKSWHIPRSLGALVMIIGFLAIFVGLLIMSIPFLTKEMVRLAAALPEYGERLYESMWPYLINLSDYVNLDDIAGLKTNAGEYIGKSLSWALKLLANLLTNTLAIANLISLIIIMPLVAFFLLRDWPKVTAQLSRLLPREQEKHIVQQVRNINDTLAGFVQGQALVCLIQAVIYSVGLLFVGLNYALTIGVVTGLLSFIPFVGMTIGVAVGMGVAFSQFSDWNSILMVAGVFAVGNIIEGNLLTPKLVGERIGLHPVWVIFALLACGSLFGFIGVIFALPIAAAIGVLVRFATNIYLDSKWYRGDHPRRKQPRKPSARRRPQRAPKQPSTENV